MARWKVPLAEFEIDDADLAAVVETYRDGWLTMGPRTEALEEAFARYTGARHAIAVTNGTAALHLICVACGLGPGDEVIVPSLTFIASVSAIAYTGATPVFADIAGTTEPWLSAASCEALIGERTRAVMAMHYGGHPGELEALRALCDRHGLALLEDAAHAAGSRLDGHHLGTFGAAGAFSLFSNKNLAVGEGGLIATDNDDLADRIRLLRSHGMTSLTWDRHRGHASSYDVVALGYNYRIDEPRAALAVSRLSRLDAENGRRAELDARYRERLAGLAIDVALPPIDALRSSHHLFTVVLQEGVDRDACRAQMAKDGIQTSVHYPPAHRMTLYRADAVRLPVTEAYADASITLPMFAAMTDAQQDAVVDALTRALA